MIKLGMRFGSKIRELRLQKNWSMRDLASRACVSAQTILLIERGHSPTLRVAVALATALETSLNDLLADN